MGPGGVGHSNPTSMFFPQKNTGLYQKYVTHTFYKHILFPDVGDLEDIEESELPKELPKPEDIKTIVVKGEKPLEEKSNEEVKTVSIDPNYKVESDK